MNRREFLQVMATRTVAATALGVAAGCAAQEAGAPVQAPGAVAQSDLPDISWQMATSWPASLETIFGSAQYFTERVAALTNGKFQIEARAAGELARGTEVLDVVSSNAVPIGHTASYYYIGKSWVCAFGTSLPFGFNARQQNSWLVGAGGLELLQEMYARKFNVIQFPAGNTGVQMGGWFRSEVNSLADLQGLKMRISGVGGAIMAALGVNVQVLPANEIYQALQTGAIDAAEWVGPYDDEVLGLNEVCDYYYVPAWWEYGPSLEVEVNLDEWNKLPPSYQAAIQSAAAEANTVMLARYDDRNGAALESLLSKGVQLRSYPQDIMDAAATEAFRLFDEQAAADADVKTVLDHWMAYRTRIYKWHNVGERAFMEYMAGAADAM